MKHLYFIRHGESVLNVQRMFAGQTDTPLTDKGRLQAKLAGERARQFNPPIDLIVSSPLSRALETATIVADIIGYQVEAIVIKDIFKERSYGSLEQKSWDLFPDEEIDFSRYPDAETDVSLLARTSLALDYLRHHTAETIAVVGHGSFYYALLRTLDPSISTDPDLSNGEIVKVL